MQPITKHTTSALVLFMALAGPWTVFAQDQAEAPAPVEQTVPAEGADATPVSNNDGASDGSPATFGAASTGVQRQLEESIAELNALQEQIAAEKIPLTRKLNDLEDELIEVRAEFNRMERANQTRQLDLSNLRLDIAARQKQAEYLADNLGKFSRDFEKHLHIAEVQRYRPRIEAATLAPENKNLTQREINRAQSALVAASLDRLDDGLGGTRYEGTAVDSTGIIREGAFVVVGPTALFRSADGKQVGAAQLEFGKLEPMIKPFRNPDDRAAASQLVETGRGTLPFDPTLGDAFVIEATQETLLEHVKKGGAVMVPIFALAGAALLVAIYKWFRLAFIRVPKPKRLDTLLDAVAKHDHAKAAAQAKAIGGPIGKMLLTGVEHLKEPRELIEEVMYEIVLATRLKLNSMLPLIAICAASAPLLGLLGTVTGIINTFKLITLFGAGDPKALSGGISEALITTKFGLIVAIPSLLMHAFLLRKARGVVDQMEKAAVALTNQVMKKPYRPPVDNAA